MRWFRNGLNVFPKHKPPHPWFIFNRKTASIPTLRKHPPLILCTNFHRNRNCQKPAKIYANEMKSNQFYSLANTWVREWKCVCVLIVRIILIYKLRTKYYVHIQKPTHMHTQGHTLFSAMGNNGTLRWVSEWMCVCILFSWPINRENVHCYWCGWLVGWIAGSKVGCEGERSAEKVCFQKRKKKQILLRCFL